MVLCVCARATLLFCRQNFFSIPNSPWQILLRHTCDIIVYDSQEGGLGELMRRADVVQFPWNATILLNPSM